MTTHTVTIQKISESTPYLTQVNILYYHLPVLIFLTPLGVALLAFVHWPVIFSSIIAVWLAAMLFLGTIPIVLHFTYTQQVKKYAHNLSYQRWFFYFFLYILLFSATWSSTLLLMSFYNSSVTHSISFFILSGIVLSVLPAISVSLPLVITFITPFFILLFYTNLLQNYLSLGIILLFFITLLLTLLRGIQQTRNLIKKSNQYINELHITKAQIRNLKDQLKNETTQHNKIADELRIAKVQAEAASLSKGEFLATMSHEIRTPLNGILPILDILRETKLNSEQQEYVQTAFSSSQHLLGIIDDILDYSKIEAGKLDIESVELSLKEIIESVTLLMKKSAERKNLQLINKIHNDIPLRLRGDPVRLRQVLTNLVSNAIKFTEKGQIIVEVIKQGVVKKNVILYFSVQDTGIGMSEDVTQRLFQPFAQADASTTRKHGGTGLGLAICKRIIELLGGEIGVKSKLGHGTTFWFTIPMRKSATDSPNTRRDLVDIRILGLALPKEIHHDIQLYFKSWGCLYEVAKNSTDAISKLKNSAILGESWAYDVCLVYTPQLNPFDVQQLLRELKASANLTGLQLLAICPREEHKTLLEKGFHEYVTTPLNKNELQRKLHLLFDVEEDSLHEFIPGNNAANTLFSGQRIESAEDIIAEIQRPSTNHSTSLETSNTVPSPSTTPQGLDFLGNQILLAEDDPVNYRVAIKVLKHMGLEILHAQNGQQALDMLEANNIDLILMDCQMPEMDGYEATTRLRQREKEQHLPHIPVIAMTANAMSGDKKKCISSGMDDYLTKPLDRDLLKKTLHNWLTPKTPAPQTQQSNDITATTPTKDVQEQQNSHPNTDKTILIIEDNPLNQRVAKNILKKAHYHVLVANHGQEGLDILATQHCDLILMDCQMPVMDGYSATQHIRQKEQQQQTNRMPIIALTANKMPGDREKCINAGMDDYLTKPLKQSTLVEAVNTWIETLPILSDTNDPDPAEPPVPPSSEHPLSALENTSDTTKKQLLTPATKILLVEDDSFNLKIAKKLLTRLNVSVNTAQNGQLALEELHKASYDIILMDCLMPEMDGYTATRHIRQGEIQKNIPIIAMTGKNQPGDKEKCLACGMNDYLSKPLKLAPLQSLLEKHLQLKKSVPSDKKITVDTKTMSVIDTEVINDLYDIMEDEFTDALNDFIHHAPQLFKEIDTAYQQQDITAIIRPAHSLKSGSANVGALTLSEYAKTLELYTNQGRTEKLDILIKRTKQEFIKAAKELQVMIQQGKP